MVTPPIGVFNLSDSEVNIIKDIRGLLENEYITIYRKEKKVIIKIEKKKEYNYFRLDKILGNRLK